MVEVQLWNLIISITIILLLSATITAAVFAYEHNKNPRLIECPPCHMGCTNNYSLEGQERCPVDPENCSVGQCIFNYMNFSSTNPFLISPISSMNTQQALFSTLTTFDNGSMVLAPYGETDATGVGLSFTYDGEHLINIKQDGGGNTLRLTVDPDINTIIPGDNIFNISGYRVYLTAETDPEILAKFELIDGLIIATINNSRFYLASRTYFDATDGNTQKTIIVGVTRFFGTTSNLWLNTLFRPIELK